MVKEDLRIVYNNTKEATKEVGNNVVEGTKNNPEIFKVIGVYLLIPLCLTIILFLIFLYQKQIKDFLVKRFGNIGYVKIWIRQNNWEIKRKLKKVDKFGMFEHNKGKYNLYNLEKYILCYENNIPVVLFFESHIFPVVVNNKQPDEQMKEDLKQIYNYDDIEDNREKDRVMNELQQELNELKLQTNPKIVKSIFDNKLLQDLYNVSVGKKLDKRVFFAILIVVAIIFLALTGNLESLINELTGGV